MSTTYTKDPSAVLDYVFDWSSWLRTIGTVTEAVVVSEINVSNTNVGGLTIGPAPSGPAISNTLTSATIWLSGGTLGRTYSVVNEVTTDMGRTERQSIVIRVANR